MITVSENSFKKKIVDLVLDTFKEEGDSFISDNLSISTGIILNNPIYKAFIKIIDFEEDKEIILRYNENRTRIFLIKGFLEDLEGFYNKIKKILNP